MSERILLVEDDAALAAGLKYALEQEEYVVDHASNLKIAREIYQAIEKRPDIVVLDVTLPDGSGFDLCQEIRMQSNIPILFLTALSEEVHVVMGLEMGADDYLAKPFRLRELISRIRAILRRQEKQSSFTAFYTDSLTIYPEAGQVLLQSEEVSFTPVEYKLLLQFVRHPGQILTREKLLEAIWDAHGNFVEDNALSVYIRRLREKIGDMEREAPAIQTIRGVGYRWQMPVRRR